MAKLALIYGMRLLPEEELGEVKDATVVLKNGRSARVTMHLIEGSKEEIENTFRQSIEASLRCILRFRAWRLEVGHWKRNQRLPKFSGSALGSPRLSLIRTVDCPVNSKRLRHL